MSRLFSLCFFILTAVFVAGCDDDDGPPPDCDKYTTESDCLAAGCGAWLPIKLAATLDGTLCTNFEYRDTFRCVAGVEDKEGEIKSYVWVRETETGREGVYIETSLSNIEGWTMCTAPEGGDSKNTYLYRLQCVCPDFDPAVCDTFKTEEGCLSSGCSDFLPDVPRAFYEDGMCTEFSQGETAPLCLLLLNGSGGQIDSGYFRTTADGTEMVILDFEGDYYGWEMCPEMSSYEHECICPAL